MLTTDVLIIEDSWLDSELLRDLLQATGALKNLSLHIYSAATEKEANRLLSERQYGIVIFDIDLDRRGAGLVLLEKFASTILLPVILSAREAKEIIEKGFKLGSEHFLRKPVEQNKVQTIIDNYIQKLEVHEHVNTIRKSFVTQDQDTLNQLYKIPNCGDAAIHISGSTGVGKQVIAELIHSIGVGKQKPFVESNCSTIEDGLADSHLFGHTKGAFTGAVDNRKGLFELANSGTLFLDEIDKTSLAFQAKLLKVIEQKIITPIGSERSMEVDFKLVTASSQDINNLVQQNKFLPDLWERLQGEVLDIKPLRERPNDIEYQLDFFIRHHSSGRMFVISNAALLILKAYHWPGNTRELKSLVDRFQRKGIKILDTQHLESLKKRAVQRKYNYVTPEILKLIEQNGLPDALEHIKKEAFDYFIQQQPTNNRKVMRNLNLSTRAYYKLLEGHTNGVQNG